jgi:hypothetical protein
MKTNKLQINIFTNELVWVGVVDSVASLVHRTSWHEIPNSELEVSKRAQGVEHIEIGRILIVNNQLDKALIVEDLTASLDSNFITFNCISLKGLLNYRVCHPTDSGSFTAARQSNVMKTLVDRNLISQTRNEDRKFLKSDGTQALSIANIADFGETLDFTVDWKTGYLGDAVVTIAKMFGIDTTAPLGWNIYIKDDYSGYEMNVEYGRHKHINQIDLPPVVFSEDFGNIKDATYEYSIKEWRNVIYTVWRDSNNNDTVTNLENDRHGATTGFNRKEFINDSSKRAAGEITNESRAELNKRPHVESFQAEIINNESTLSTYKEDWFLGDIVTIQSKAVLQDKLISIDAQITGIEEVYDSGEYSINATFGEGSLSVFELIKQSIEQKK